MQVLAELAARLGGAEAALILLEGGGEPAAAAGPGAALACRDVRAWPGRMLAAVPLATPDGLILGRLCLLGPADGVHLPEPDRHALHLLAGLAAQHVLQEQRGAELRALALRAARTERMLHLIAEARSITDALTSMLEELCTHHGATVGRIWRMIAPGDLMQEISRYNDDGLDENSYYRCPPTAPVRWGNSFTAEAIRSGTPRAVIYSQVEHPDRYVLLQAAIHSGLRSQVSYPIWVDGARFGVSLAFTAERADLRDVVADVAALANAIRPALFRRVSEDRIRFLAHHDDLTGLANRLLFGERMAKALAATGAGGLALLYLDLDRFKQVNDMRGHTVGDKLLAAVAQRLREGTRDGDTVARMGGDEFAVIQPGDDQPAAATCLAQRLADTLAQPFLIEGQRLHVGCSIGIATYPRHGATVDALLRSADAALYHAKATGRGGTAVYEPGMGSSRTEDERLEADMEAALADRGFTLVFQPMRDATSLAVVGYEALLRWTHPVRGPILPERFVRLAETSGLILPLGAWALEAACAAAVHWNPAVRLAVNLSPLQFRQPDLPEQVAAILRRTGLPPHRLDLEVTEGLLLDDTGPVLDTMRALRAQGIGMTLDDFGTAYASLSYLRRFPFDRIKIDKSFVQSVATDGATLAIVRAILSLSFQLNLGVVGEGVEDQEQLDVLRGLGCGVVQGFLTGRPRPDVLPPVGEGTAPHPVYSGGARF